MWRFYCKIMKLFFQTTPLSTCNMHPVRGRAGSAAGRLKRQSFCWYWNSYVLHIIIKLHTVDVHQPPHDTKTFSGWSFLLLEEFSNLLPFHFSLHVGGHNFPQVFTLKVRISFGQIGQIHRASISLEWTPFAAGATVCDLHWWDGCRVQQQSNGRWEGEITRTREVSETESVEKWDRVLFDVCCWCWGSRTLQTHYDEKHREETEDRHMEGKSEDFKEGSEHVGDILIDWREQRTERPAGFAGALKILIFIVFYFSNCKTNNCRSCIVTRLPEKCSHRLFVQVPITTHKCQ